MGRMRVGEDGQLVPCRASFELERFKAKHGIDKKPLTEEWVRGLPVMPGRAYHAWDHGKRRSGAQRERQQRELGRLLQVVAEKAALTDATEQQVAELVAQLKAVKDPGDPVNGLAVMVQKSGTKTYYCFFYEPGTKAPLPIKVGRVGEVTLAEAREKARAIRKLADDGKDPREHDPKRSLGFAACVDEYIEQECIGRKGNKSALQTKGIILGHCAKWKYRPVGTITAAEINSLLVKLRGKTPAISNRLHGHLAAFFRWCWRVEKRPDFVMKNIPKPWDGAKGRDFDWFKGDKADEVIKGLWRIAQEAGGDDERFIKALIFTGKRRGVVAEMTWEQIDRAWFWTPSEGSSTKRNNPLPLSKLMQRVLGPRRDSGRIMRMGYGSVRRLQMTVRRQLGLSNFVFHGVRHIVETKLGELRVAPHVRDVLLDHAIARSRSGAGYDHHDYEAEMREAMEAWADYVQALVTPAENVAVLR